jgi:hypothetical protein
VSNGLLLTIGASCGAFLAIVGVLGVFWRIALPWIREQIVNPVQTTCEQVTNSHDTNLRDDITELGHKLDQHLTWSVEETQRLWAAIAGKANRE